MVLLCGKRKLSLPAAKAGCLAPQQGTVWLNAAVNRLGDRACMWQQVVWIQVGCEECCCCPSGIMVSTLLVLGDSVQAVVAAVKDRSW